jgi:hypothetical protein
LRATETGCWIATAPPELTWNSGGFVIGVYRCFCTRGALLGVGATFEGIFRKHMILPDSVRDSAWYAIVDDDWPAVKARLRQRLETAEAVSTQP